MGAQNPTTGRSSGCISAEPVLRLRSGQQWYTDFNLGVGELTQGKSLPIMYSSKIVLFLRPIRCGHAPVLESSIRAVDRISGTF
jgi:hypothetical protein